MGKMPAPPLPPPGSAASRDPREHRRPVRQLWKVPRPRVTPESQDSPTHTPQSKLLSLHRSPRFSTVARVASLGSVGAEGE